ncbi:MAG: hypothetical protein V3S01_07065 [Dehalococcoidia bacterium]
MSSLCLHDGAKLATLDQLRTLPRPEVLGARHYPLPHYILRDTVVRSVEERGVRVLDERIALTPDGKRYFGLLTLEPGSLSLPSDWTMAVGIRGSVDQAFAESVCGGSQVFVCDNLAFSGEVKVARKNTMHCRRDLPGRVETAIAQLLGQADRMKRRYDGYRNSHFSDRAVDRTLMGLVRDKALPASKIPAILGEFAEPSHQEHGHRTAWTFFNAVTEVLKGTNAERMVGRTISLHNHVDREVVGISAG